MMSTPREPMCLLLPPDLKDRVREVARENRRSMTKEIQIALENHVAEESEIPCKQRKQ